MNIIALCKISKGIYTAFISPFYGGDHIHEVILHMSDYEEENIVKYNSKIIFNDYISAHNFAHCEEYGNSIESMD